MAVFDFKKEYKDLYQPASNPVIVDVPAMQFLMVNGHGNPNDTDGAYAQAVEMLYTLSYAIKMSKMGADVPTGYFDFVVPPLEGLWWIEGLAGYDFNRKNDFSWISMIRQPEFVDDAVLVSAKAKAAKKSPDLPLSRVRLESFTEGLCVQCLHVGPYDSEPATVAAMDAFAAQSGFTVDLSDTRRHHEIYLGDPRRTAPERLKTVIRHPVKK